MSRLSRLVKSSGLVAAAGVLTLLGTGVAHAVGVSASAPDARFTGSYYITNTAVKINGTLQDFGAFSGGAGVYVNVHSTEGDINWTAVEVGDGGNKTIGTRYAYYGGTFLSANITACSYASSGAWKCGTPVAIYK